MEGLQLPRLRYLRISGKRRAIDFGRLRTLTKLIIEHRPKDRGSIELSGLTMMHSWRYKPTQAASDLTLPTGLQELLACWSPMETISSLGPLPDLRDLRLARCRNFRDLGNLKTNFPRLERLTIEACGRLTVDEAKRAVSDHPALTRVVAANKHIFGD